MSNKTTHAQHVQNLNSLRNYIQKMESGLTALSHTIGADLKSLETSLNKGKAHPRKYLPKPPKVPASFEQLLLKGIVGGRAATSTYRASNGQVWAQVASAVTKAIGRGL